jgi:hypothetical protein
LNRATSSFSSNIGLHWRLAFSASCSENVFIVCFCASQRLSHKSQKCYVFKNSTNNATKKFVFKMTQEKCVNPNQFGDIASYKVFDKIVVIF